MSIPKSTYLSLVVVPAGPAHTRGARSGHTVIPASSAAQGLLPHEGPSAHAVRPRSDSPDQSPSHRRNTRSPDRDRATTADSIGAAPGSAAAGGGTAGGGGGDRSSPHTSPVRQAGGLMGRPLSAGPLAPPTSPASTRVLSPPPSQPQLGQQQMYGEFPPEGVQGYGISSAQPFGRGMGYLGGYNESSWHPSFLTLPYAPVGPYMRQDPIEALIDSLHVSQTLVPHIAHRKQHHVHQMQQYENMKHALQTAQVGKTAGDVLLRLLHLEAAQTAQGRERGVQMPGCVPIISASRQTAQHLPHVSCMRYTNSPPAALARALEPTTHCATLPILSPGRQHECGGHPGAARIHPAASRHSPTPSQGSHCGSGQGSQQGKCISRTRWVGLRGTGACGAGNFLMGPQNGG
jgi:hypothetical protein